MKLSINTFTVLLAFFFPTAATSLLYAHSDILLVDVGGQVTIGAAEDIDGAEESFDTETKLFETILVPGFVPPTPADYETGEPGFFALHAATDAADLASLGANALPSSSSVSANSPSFDFDGDNASLFYWDATGAVDFSPAPVGTTFSFDPTVAFATTGANGEMDDHPIFQLEKAGAGVPDDGVYLISPTVDVAGLSTSDNFYIVMLVDSLIGSVNDAEDDLEAIEHALEEIEKGLATDAVVDLGGGNIKDFAFFEEAVEFVEEATTIPEPSTFVLGLSALLAAALTKRNR